MNLSQIFFPQSVPIDKWHPVLTTPRQKLRQIPVFFETSKVDEKQSLCQKNFPSKISYGHIESSAQPAEQFDFDGKPRFVRTFFEKESEKNHFLEGKISIK